MKRLSGMAKGWAHHYRFCNDKPSLASVDQKIVGVFMSYVEKAIKIAGNKNPKISPVLLGYSGLSAVTFEPFSWPG
jgi:hypothetical protein